MADHREAQIRTNKLEKKLTFLDQFTKSARYKEYIRLTVDELDLKEQIDYVAKVTFPTSLKIELTEILLQS
jgi:hypothetical protein